MPYDPDKELTKIRTPNTKLLFYPSCGTDSKWLTNFDCNVVVASDYYPNTKAKRYRFWQEFRNNMDVEVSLVASTVRTRIFRFKNKIGFLFFQDNNEVLERIKNSGNKISCFIGKCDGCGEGGNYECVNDLKFFKKVLSLVSIDGMIYITDHSQYLLPRANHCDCSIPESYKEFILGDKFFRRVNSESGCINPGGYRPITTYMVSVHRPTVFEMKLDHLRITIEHDSIANHLSELNGAIMSKRCKYLCEQTNLKATNLIDIVHPYCDYYKPNPNKFSCWSPAKSLQYFLKMCDKRKWNIAGTTAFREGEHSKMIAILKNWKSEFPKWIRIFHLDSKDYVEFKQQFA